jgi:hypothetical protein
MQSARGYCRGGAVGSRKAVGRGSWRSYMAIVRVDVVRLAHLAALGVIAVVPAAATASSKPKLRLGVSPSAPHVDDDLRVSFTSPGIRTGYSFAVLVAGAGSCDGKEVAETDVKGPRPPGKRITVRFSPTDNIVTGNQEWCRGRAYAFVTLDRHGSAVKKLGRLDFRFSAKP